MYGTGAALGDAAAEFGTCQAKLVADNPEQRSFGRDVDRMPSSIHGQVHCHSIPSLIDHSRERTSVATFRNRRNPAHLLREVAEHRCLPAYRGSPRILTEQVKHLYAAPGPMRRMRGGGRRKLLLTPPD